MARKEVDNKVEMEKSTFKDGTDVEEVENVDTLFEDLDSTSD